MFHGAQLSPEMVNVLGACRDLYAHESGNCRHTSLDNTCDACRMQVRRLLAFCKCSGCGFGK